MAQRQKRAQGRGKKHRKHGRWKRKPANMRYLAREQWARNKARRIRRQLRRNPELVLDRSFPNLSEQTKRYL